MLNDMVDRDIHYFLPIFEERLRADRRPPPEFPAAVVVVDDDLDDRIGRLESNLVWMEDPPSRIRHLITNVEACTTDEDGEIETYSNFLVCRNRGEREERMLVGGRHDRLRSYGRQFKLVRREITISQRVVLDTNIYFFM